MLKVFNKFASDSIELRIDSNTLERAMSPGKASLNAMQEAL